MFNVNGNVMNPVAIAWLGMKQQCKPKADCWRGLSVFVAFA
ncbi:hypothetical protein SynMEDNS5_01944 [Synechococcus sp. MEDNS5]|nr:hypothetical protein SynMEDNS5_01944 [Synechococcus sp. MEDNS5]